MHQNFKHIGISGTLEMQCVRISAVVELSEFQYMKIANILELSNLQCITINPNF